MKKVIYCFSGKPVWNHSCIGCNACVVYCPKDLYRWSAALHGGKVLSDEMYKKMTEVHTDCGDGTSYGYGLMIFDGSEGRVYMHSGSTPRFLCHVMYSTQRELLLALMSNHASESLFSVAKDVSNKILQEIDKR